jgi:signal transduction histidine kinase
MNFKKTLNNFKNVDQKLCGQNCTEIDKILLIVFWVHVPIISFLMPIGVGTAKEALVSSLTLALIAQLTYHFFKGTLFSRTVFGIILMSFSLVLIAVRLGQIEMHFHILAFIPVLALYKDWRVFIPAALFTSTHHILFSYCQINDITLSFFPIKIFQFVGGWDIVFTHIGFVTIEVSCLIFLTQKLLNLEYRQKTVTELLEKRVLERTKVIQLEAEKTQEALAIAHEAQEQIVASDQRKEELLRILTHDLVNPLTSAQARVDLMIKKMGNEYQNQFIRLTANFSNCFEIIDLIRNLLALEKGKYTLKIEQFELEYLVNRSHDMLKEKFVDKKVELVIDIHQKTHVFVEEVSFVNSVLNNLLTNAIKFSDEGSQIFISAAEEGEITQVTIKDQGIGIPPKILENLFSPHEATSRKGTGGEKGTGFGMPLVKKFVECYEGTIQINSIEEGSEHGTTISIYLPAHQAAKLSA